MFNILYILNILSKMSPTDVHPIAKLFKNMHALTMHALKYKCPSEEEQMDVSVFEEHMADSVFVELQKFNAFEEHGSSIENNSSFRLHLISCKVLTRDSRAGNRMTEARIAWENLNTDRNMCVAKIYYEYYFDIGQNIEWKEMHPHANTCSTI